MKPDRFENIDKEMHRRFVKAEETGKPFEGYVTCCDACDQHRAAVAAMHCAVGFRKNYKNCGRASGI